jgi:hypothetical protein
MAHAPCVLRGHFIGLRIGLSSFLAWDCGGNLVGNGPADASSDARADSYAGPCMISASSYDQSCAVDTDCQEVSSGDYCSASTCLTGGSAINAGALAQFNDDVSKTPLGSGVLGSVFCGRRFSSTLCCRQGQCEAQPSACSPPADTFPSCADAGGTCTLSVQTTCFMTGPPDGCAYSDEVCCLN